MQRTGGPALNHLALALAAPAVLLFAAACSPISEPAAAAPVRTAACAAADGRSGSAAKVAAAARAFRDSLSAEQRAKLSHPLELQYAIRWSNYPAALVPRNGVAFGDMDAAQVAAARALIMAAAGACGAQLFDENREADVIGHKALPQVGPGWHYVSLNGEPSDTRPWMLMISGHHLDYNFVFNGPTPGATPLFAGSDPARFTDAAGRAHYPMQRQGDALSALGRAVAKYPQAHLPGIFTDLVKSVTSFGQPGGPGPGPAAGPPAGQGDFFAFAQRSGRGMDTNYPLSFTTGRTGRGVAFTALTPAEQALVRRAIEAYAALPGRRIAEPLLALYETPSALAETYVGLSGDPNLVAPNSYIRIDGPRVWIELSVQESLVDRKDTHFHSLWRDKVSDYGGQFAS